MSLTIESGYTSTLSAKLTAAATTMSVVTAPTVTAGRLYLRRGSTEEWISYTGVSGTTLTGLTRGLSQTADPATAGSWTSWVAWTVITLVFMHDQTFDRQAPLPLTFATAAARDTALWADWVATSGWVNIEVTATGLKYNYNLSTAQWESVDTGTATPNATETAAGKVELPTDAQVTAKTAIGETGATLTPTNAQMAKSVSLRAQATSMLHSDEFGINVSWENKRIALSAIVKFGWDGSDGAVSWAETITGSNDTYIVKNYTTFTPWANTVDITPTNCITHIKVQWDCDLTSSTIDFSCKWGVWGAGWAINPDADWLPWVDGQDWLTNQNIYLPEWGNLWVGGVNGSSTDGWAASTIPFTIEQDFLQSLRAINLSVGAGWAGGGSWKDQLSWEAWAGWAGWAGGGVIILEVWGNLTFATSTVTVAWDVWVAWGAGTTWGNQWWGWAGWGWGGWMFICLFNWTLTWSVTPTVSWGAGWTGWANLWASNDIWGGGWSGGAASNWDSTVWWNSGTSNKWGDGWAWAAWLFLIEQNQVFT